MDTACEPDSSVTPTTQEEPPSPKDDIQEKLPNEDDATVSKDCLKKEETRAFPVITLEMFENKFRQLVNGEDDDAQQEGLTFRGYPEQEKDFFFQYADKKSEIIYDIFQRAISHHKKSMLICAKGRISVPISSKKMEAYLISPKYCQKPNVPKKLNPVGKRDLKKMKPQQKKPCQQKVTSNAIGNGNSSLVSETSNSASSAPVRASRLIQTPKRYLDGEEGRPRTVKRTHRRTAEDLFEMGLLHPKYPKKMEMSSPGNGNIDKDMVTPKKSKKTISCVSGGANSMFAISNMLNSGELQYVLNLYHLELQHKQTLERLELELQCLPKTGKPTPNKFESINGSCHSNQSHQTLAIERPAPSSSNVLTIVPLKLNKPPAPPPPPALVPIQRSSPESMTKHSGSVVTITKAQPKALQSSFKAAENATTAKGQGNVRNSPKRIHHVYPPNSKILPKVPVGIVGPFPQPPVLTGKTFKKSTMQSKSPQHTIRQDNGSSQTRDIIPDFMMNFLGSNYGLSSTSESRRVSMTPPPPRSFLWHPELGELTAANEEVKRMLSSFLTKCPV